MSALPYLSPILIPFFAFAYRMRGGFLTAGLKRTQLTRLLCWSLPVALAVLPVSLLWAVPCAVMAFIGILIPHSEFMASASLKNSLGMAAIGLIRFLLILSPLAIFHPLILLCGLSATLSGLAYFVGWKWLNGKAFIIFGQNCATGGSEWGELLTGAAFGLGFIGVWIYELILSQLSIWQKIFDFFVRFV